MQNLFQQLENNIQKEVSQQEKHYFQPVVLIDQFNCYDQSRVANVDPQQQNEIFEETTCQICLNEIANNPILCPECNKVFGHQCAKKLYQNFPGQHPICPSCKQPWKQDLEKLKNRFARDMIAKQYKIKCKNVDSGCNEIMKCMQQMIISHENACPFEEVECICLDKKCGWKGLKSQFEKHQEQECPYKIMECQFCRDQNESLYEFFKKEDHHLLCQNQPQACKYCSQYYTRKQIYNHQNLYCQKRIFTCKGCNKKLNREQFLLHENENCYIPGKEKEMFDKIQEQIKLQNEKHNNEIRQQIINNNKTNLKVKLGLRLLKTPNRFEILNDFDRGIYHINSLEQLYEIYHSGLEIKSVIINETDLHRYTYSRNCTKNYLPVIENLKKLASQGDAWSQFSLGLLYYCGDKDIDMDDKMAFEWASRSANQNNPGGLCLLGLHYLFGYYVEKNYCKAIQYFIQSSEQVFPPSFYYLGDCYYHGKGIDIPNEEKGVELYFQSAELGYPYALKCIAEKYEEEVILTQNQSEKYEKAYQYYIEAAEKGVLGAMKAVYEYLNEGKGVRQNQVQAKIWQSKIINFELQEQQQKKEDQEIDLQFL